METQAINSNQAESIYRSTDPILGLHMMAIYERLGTCAKYRTRRAHLALFFLVALAPPRASAWVSPNLLSINMALPPSIRSPELNRFQRPSSRGSGRSRDMTCWAVNSGITCVMRPRFIHDGATGERHRNQRSRSTPALSMKVKSRRGERGGSPATANRSPKGRKSLLIEVQDMASDAWKLEEAAAILRDGGVGVIPTDTCYTFACDLHSRRGVERILQIKNEQGRHKPLTLLCKDISTMNLYARGIDKGLFKTMKAILPGPYTFILPSTNEVPRMLREHKHHKKTWKRKEIGIRLPDAPILLHLLAKLDRPLICGSVPAALSSEGSEEEEEEGEDGSDGEGAREAWREDTMVSGDPYAIDRTFGHAVDFVVDAGVLEVGGYSTIVDAVGAEPVILREGIGNPFLVTSK